MLNWLIIAVLTATPGDQWPAFRGDGTSISSAAQLPTTWSDDLNIAWTVEIPGYGQSSPVVWGDRVFVSSTQGAEKDQVLLSCFSSTSGEKLWTREAAASQKVKASDYVSRGAPTPVVDAERVYVFFESGDLLAWSHAGELLWQRSLVKDFGEFQGNHGIGASITTTQQGVVVLVNHSGPSYILAVDKLTGKDLWKVDRDPKVSWTSPALRTWNGRQEIIVSSNGGVDAYAAETGERLWWVSGIDGNTTASPTCLNDLVLVGSSKTKQNLAVKGDGQGDVTATAIQWRSEEATSSFGSPLIYQGIAYFVNKAGILFALDATTGETLWNERLPDTCWASPIGADGRVYVFTKGGTTVVYRAGKEQERIAENVLTTEDRLYGVAAVNQAFFVRSGSRLWRISPREETTAQ